MKLKGPKALTKRAVFAATLLSASNFELELEYSDEGSECIQYDDGSFLITIETNTPKVLLMEHIGHEMVHLSQMSKGDLVMLDEGGAIWKNQHYPPAEHMSDEYLLAPWELEARSLEAWFVHRWEIRNELH